MTMLLKCSESTPFWVHLAHLLLVIKKTMEFSGTLSFTSSVNNLPNGSQQNPGTHICLMDWQPLL